MPKNDFQQNFPKTFAAIEAGRTSGYHAGAQIYVSRAAAVLASEGLGESQPGIQMTADSILIWFSAGKPITAVAIARLWQAGKLDLDDPVIRFIPEFAARGKERISIRHLLTHTAGIRMVEWSQSWDEIISRICNAPIEPRWIPGLTAGYHAFTTWYLLGEILRRLDPKHPPFERYITEEIFEPLGMNDCFFALSAAQIQTLGSRISRIQATSNTTGPASAFYDTEAGSAVASPGASARGPGRELGRFYEMMLNHGENLLTPQTTEALTARHRAGIQDLTFKHIMDWGLGFVINSAQYKQPSLPYAFGPHASLRTFGHGGNQSSIAFADPEHKLAVALIFNGMPGEPAHQRRTTETLTGLYEDLGITENPAAMLV